MTADSHLRQSDSPVCEAHSNIQTGPYCPVCLVAERTGDTTTAPAEGDARWDAAVDAVMEKFGVPESYAQRVVATVLGAVADD